MSLLTLNNAHLAFGHVPLLKATDLTIIESERIGLIGRNGTGKSSLIKIIAGLSQLDDGRMTARSNLKVNIVTQEPEFGSAITVFEGVAQAYTREIAVLREYEALSENFTDSQEHADRLGVLQGQMESNGIWQLQNRVTEIILRCNLEPEMIITKLSGGQRKRAALARALVTEPDLLLLDEPTNHLDFSGIEWLENLLNEFSGTSFFITHDRQFLDRVATRIIELDRGILRSYPGNFAAYQERKAFELHAEQLANERFDKLLAQEEIWIRKGVEARRTRNEGRVRRLQGLRGERQARLERTGQLSMEVGQAERSGALVCDLSHVSMEFAQAQGAPRVLIKDFSALIMRGDKVGLIGDNGCGKTTLLKIILGQLEPTSGTAKRGTKLEVAYFDQMRSALNEEASLVETISPGSDWIEINGQRKHVMSYLSDFLFSPERARSPVKSLSGGERNRLLLARLFAKPSNLLVLDEPTNDLDMESLDLLEELLSEYPGTVLLVSHDRRFLDNVVTQSIACLDEGLWWNIAGGYSVWAAQSQALRARQKNEAQRSNEAASANLEKTVPNAAAAPRKPTQKLSYKQQRLLADLPNQIEALEQEQKLAQTHLADGSLYAKDPARAQSLAQRIAAIEDELITLLSQWEELTALTTG